MRQDESGSVAAGAAPGRVGWAAWVPLALSLAVAVGFVVYSLTYPGSRTIGYSDDGQYVVSARALRSGLGYTLPSRPGSPAARKYPIGFPLYLAAFLRLGSSGSLPQDTRCAWAAVAVAGGLFLWTAYGVLRRLDVPAAAAVLLTAGLAAGRAMTLDEQFILSDALYGTLANVVLLLAARVVSRPGGTAAWLGIAAAAAAAAVVRTQGLVLLLLLVPPAVRAVRRTRLPLVAVLAAAAAVLVPSAVARHGPGSTGGPAAAGDTYGHELGLAYRSASAAPRQLWADLTGLWRAVPECVFPNPLEMDQAVASRLSAHPAALGGLRAAVFILQAAVWAMVGRFAYTSAKHKGFLFGYAALTCGVVVLWPFPGDDVRFLLTLAPFCLAAVVRVAVVRVVVVRVVGGRVVGGRVGTGGTRSVPVASAAVAAVLVLCWSAIAIHVRSRGRQAAGPDPLVTALTENASRLPPDAVLVSTYPEVCFLYGRRQAIPLVEFDQLVYGTVGNAVWTARLRARLAAVSGRPAFLLDTAGDPGHPYAVALRRSAGFRVDPESLPAPPGVTLSRVQLTPAMSPASTGPFTPGPVR